MSGIPPSILLNTNTNPLSLEKRSKTKWPKQGSILYKELVKIITDNRLMHELEQMVDFCHAGDIESFHSFLLKYCPKRVGYSFEGMLARTEFAILYQNNSFDRKQAITTDDKPRFNVVFSTQSKSWVARPIKENKKHGQKI